MRKLAITTDMAADMPEGFFAEHGVTVLPMPFTVGGKDYFDAIATHPYGWGPDASPGVAAQFQAFKQLLAENGDQGKEIWITEFGTSTFRSSLLEQQPDVFLRAIDLAMKKNRPEAAVKAQSRRTSRTAHPRQNRRCAAKMAAGRRVCETHAGRTFQTRSAGSSGLHRMRKSRNRRGLS